MKIGTVSNSKFIVRLVRGEEVVASLNSFCLKQKISNAVFWGIGSIENVTLAHYRVDTKKFSDKTFEGIYEITSLMGNVGIVDGKPLIHPHITISDEKMNVYGGHLVKGMVSATVEVILEKLESSFEKKFDEDIGLKLWEM